MVLKDSMRVKIDLNKVLADLLDENGKAAIVTGVGRCDVCGKVHRSEGSWKACADKRISFMENQSLIFKPRQVMEPYMADALNIDYRLEVLGLRGIMAAVFPWERIKEGEEKAKRVIEETLKRMRRIASEKIKHRIGLYALEVGVKPSFFLNEGDLTAAIMKVFAHALLSPEPPVIVKMEGRVRKISPNLNSTLARLFMLRENELYKGFTSFEWWLVSRMGVVKKKGCGQVDTYKILGIDRKRGEAIVKVNTKWVSNFKSKQETHYYKVHLLDLRKYEEISPRRASIILKELNKEAEKLEKDFLIEV